MDSRKCQTSTVTPAKPGDFSFLFNGMLKESKGGKEKKDLQTAKKLLEQSKRLGQKGDMR